MRRIVFLMILFITVSMLLVAQNKELLEEETTVITRNPDPIRFPEITYEEYRAKHPLSVQSFHQEINYISNDERDNDNFLIIVDPTIQTSISSALATYQSDLLNESLNSFLVAFSGTSAEDVKTIISSYFSSDNIVGSILIGDIPSAWYEYEKHDSLGVPTGEWSEFPIDLFYADMDGTWSDSDSDGMYDVHTGNVHPDIWVGRIKADNLFISNKTEVEMINDYFNRNHLFRNGMLTMPGTALAYVDDDWSSNGNYYQSSLEYIYPNPNTELINESQATNGVDYMDNRLPANYEFIQVMVHSSPIHHGFKAVDGPDTTWTNVMNSDLVNIQPNAYFYNLFACSNCRYENDNCMGNIYLLDNDYCLNVIGTTKTGSMLYFADFYEPLSLDNTFGQSLVEWWALHVDSPTPTYSQVHWFYGNLILGDPTLRIDYYNPNISLWTGNVSGGWDISGNWYNGNVPNDTKDVIIPAGTPNDPWIIAANADCQNLTIESGATLTIHGRTLEVEEDVEIYGELVMDDNSSVLTVNDDLRWMTDSTADISATGAVINVYDTFEFKSASNAELENGTVYIKGTTNSSIVSRNTSCSIENLYLDKSSYANVYIGSEFSQKLRILGDLTIGSYSTLRNFYDNNDLTLMGDLTSYGHMFLDHATVDFWGSDQQINLNSNDYFNDIELIGNIILYDNIIIKGELDFHTGEMDANGYDIFMEGDWLINYYYPSSFTAGSGTVTFNGTGDQICNGGNFNVLKLYKSSGELIIQNAGRSMVQCNSYDWTQGILTIDGGNMTILDLADNGFYGTTQVLSGTLNIFQDVSQYVDLNGSLIIYDGEVNVHGGDDTSYWPYSEDAYLYMEGGTLDFTEHSIYINTSHAFSHVISGGIIKATGDFTIERHDFHPTGGRVELYGPDAASVNLDWGNYFHILEIDKESSRSGKENAMKISASKNKKKSILRPDSPVYENSRTNSVTVQSDMEIHNNLYINNGTFIMDGHTVEVLQDVWIYGTLEMTNSLDHLDVSDDVKWKNGSSDIVTAGEIALGGNWEFEGGTTAYLGVGNTVRFDGSGTSEITIGEFDNAGFGTVILDKTSGLTEQSTYYSAYLKINGDLTLNENDVFNAYRVQTAGELFMDPGSELNMSSGDFDVLSDVNCDGHLNLEGGYFTASDAFTLTGILTIDGGNCKLNRPYTGNYMSFAGVLNILDGYLEITFDGIQFATGATPNMTNGFIRVGGNFRATQSNAFQPTGGTIEFMSTEWSTIECNNGNYFHNLEVDKVYATRGCFLADDVIINNDLTLSTGKLQGSGYEITVNNDVTIHSSGVLDPDDELLKVGRWWTNNRGSVGFVEGNGTVELFGSLEGEIKTDETFYNLKINKTTGDMYYTEI
ncbi:MAG TPA: hypothetical protein ENL20_01455, partial [Candidatus Cloacimonetes bacterium]|nr:hypothetical protein [Candidatus Cloacimonadota bacterium]